MAKTNPSLHLEDDETRDKWRSLIQTLNPEIEPSAIRLMEQLRQVWRTLYVIGENSIDASGLSYAQYRILLSLFYAEELHGRSQLNPSEISDAQGTSRNTISGLIRALENEGLVERQLDEQDRRKFNIRLSQRGRALVKTHSSAHMQTVSQCFTALSPAEQETLQQLLAKVDEQATKGINLCK